MAIAQRHRAIFATVVVVVVALVAAVAAFFALRSEDPDVELEGGFATWALDGARELRTPDAGPATQFAGDGTVAAVMAVRNPGDEPLRLSVPDDQRQELASAGIGVRVGYQPTPDRYGLPPRIRPSQLSTELPVEGRGAIVHLFTLRDCRPNEPVFVHRYGLDVAAGGGDPHRAEVEVTLSQTANEKELRPYESEAADYAGALELRGCQ